MTRLRTDRLTLRPLMRMDADAFRRLMADPDATRGLKHGTLDALGADALLETYVRAWADDGIGMWLIEAAGDRAVVGIAGLLKHEDGHGWSLRYAIAPAHQGFGCAREATAAIVEHAFTAGRVVRVVAICRDDNPASMAVIRGLGMALMERDLDGIAGRDMYALDRPPEAAREA